MSHLDGYSTNNYSGTAVILVDHGSRRTESNEQLKAVADLFRATTDWPIVKYAHMELAEPSIPTAMDECVMEGAASVVVFPWFLAPGRHWNEDIPRLVEAAAASHTGLKTLVTAPFGRDELLTQLANKRIHDCLGAAQQGGHCSVCGDPTRCTTKIEFV